MNKLFDTSEFKLSVYEDHKVYNSSFLIIDFKIESYEEENKYETEYIMITQNSDAYKITEDDICRSISLSDEIDNIHMLINSKSIDLYKIIEDWRAKN